MTRSLELPFELTTAERLSPVWRRIEAHLAARLEVLRVRNDQMMSEPDRCLQLGRIAEIKLLLDLGKEVPLETFSGRLGTPDTAI